MRTIAELGQIALQGVSVADICRLASERARQTLAADCAMVLWHAESGPHLVVEAAAGWEGHVHAGITAISWHAAGGPDRPSASDGVLPDDWVSFESGIDLSGPMAARGVTAGCSVVIPGRAGPYGVLAVHSGGAREFTSDDLDFLRATANIIASVARGAGLLEKLEIHTHTQERRARFQEALARCARALLASRGDNRLEEAVEALLDATQATYVFVERNVIDPQFGFSSQTVAEVEEGGPLNPEDWGEYWSLVPWSQMPISRSYLEAGRPFVVIPDQLHGVERELYEADPFPIKSELDIPIFVDGEWAGLVGFADSEIVREWTEEDISLLTTAASMIGAFWERESNRADLERTIGAKDELVASVSHELRTPLTAVVGFGRILHDESETLSRDEHREISAALVGQGVDLSNIVNDLLIAAKADINTLPVDIQSVNLTLQAAQVLEAYDSSRIGRMDPADDPVNAFADASRVRQILRNLVTNALRYGGAEIEVRVFAGADGAIAQVVDSGPPLSEDDRDRIFHPYQRAHARPGMVGAMGLGLPISRGLARRMAGDLVYRHEGGFSVFELSLPKAG